MNESIDSYVVGAGMIPMGRYPDSSYAALGAPPVRAALRSCGLSLQDVRAVWCGHSFGGMLAGQRIIKDAGLGGLPVTNVENACSGGATAFHEAYNAVSSGSCDVALVIGIDKLSQFGQGTL